MTPCTYRPRYLYAATRDIARCDIIDYTNWWIDSSGAAWTRMGERIGIITDHSADEYLRSLDPGSIVLCGYGPSIRQHVAMRGVILQAFPDDLLPTDRRAEH